MVKRILFLAFGLIALTTFAQEVKVMSYNIRLDVASDGDNRWEIRRQTMANLINYYAPDFLGTQEVLENQRTYLLQQLPQYKTIGVGRKDGKSSGEYSCIFYQPAKYKLIQQATFWLSPTPKVIASVGWDAALERVCTYGLFQHKKSKQFIWVVNTHFDHMGDTARYESAKLIWNTINTLKKAHPYPVVFMGDLNSRPADPPIVFLDEVMTNTRAVSKQAPLGPSDTWNGFQFNQKPNGCIDYIFIEKQSPLIVHKFITITQSYDQKYPSDHLPIMATLNYK
ncbi:MAG: endonuclease/exonuclease/phosphatase family protein [Ferruginibacter sp.]